MNDCLICEKKILKVTDYIGLVFEDKEVYICSDCIEDMTDVVEHYWMQKELQEEDKVIH